MSLRVVCFKRWGKKNNFGENLQRWIRHKLIDLTIFFFFLIFKKKVIWWNNEDHLVSCLVELVKSSECCVFRANVYSLYDPFRLETILTGDMHSGVKQFWCFHLRFWVLWWSLCSWKVSLLCMFYISRSLIPVVP